MSQPTHERPQLTLQLGKMVDIFLPFTNEKNIENNESGSDEGSGARCEWD